MSKYVRVMDGLKSNASGKEFEIDKVIEADTWNPTETDPEKMGGFNFSTEDKILRYIFRGDTIYDVIIPNDAEVIVCDSKNAPKAIYRANKIIVTNPKTITEDMVIDIYKKSTLPLKTYFQCIYCLLFRGYKNASKYIINDIVNKNNIDEAIKEFEDFSIRSKDNTTGIFEYDKLFPDAKEIYDILKSIQNNEITFRELKDNEEEFKQIHKWCNNEFVYEWFEQRVLSLDEIITKYKNKLNNNKQDIFIINYNGKDIGLFQIYKFERDIDLKELDKFKNIYEYDLFIGEEEYLSKGIGTKIVKQINEMLYSKYQVDAIILRPFKRNIRAINCYKKCNFKLIKEYDGVDTLGNKEIISILLLWR